MPDLDLVLDRNPISPVLSRIDSLSSMNESWGSLFDATNAFVLSESFHTLLNYWCICYLKSYTQDSLAWVIENSMDMSNQGYPIRGDRNSAAKFKMTLLFILTIEEDTSLLKNHLVQLVGDIAVCVKATSYKFIVGLVPPKDLWYFKLFHNLSVKAGRGLGTLQNEEEIACLHCRWRALYHESFGSVLPCCFLFMCTYFGFIFSNNDITSEK